MILKSLLQTCSSAWFALPWWMITVLFDHHLPALSSGFCFAGTAFILTPYTAARVRMGWPSAARISSFVQPAQHL
jgi:hypothetical protein